MGASGICEKLGLGEKERNSKGFLLNAWRMLAPLQQNKMLRFHLPQNVQLKLCLYQDNPVSTGLHWMMVISFLLFLVKRICKVETCINMLAIPFINNFNCLEISVPAG